MKNEFCENTALIGSTGYVGSTLQKQTNFSALYNSKTIPQINGLTYDSVICAAAPAQKWVANRDPISDRKTIDSLISHLKTVTTEKFILISTVDVFSNPINVNEFNKIDENSLQPYGAHRRLLEKFVEDHFKNYLIIRLPGLVGPGLRKNAIFDLHNNNNLHDIDSRSVFQFYPMINLWHDIQIALKENLKLVHFTSAPISIKDAANLGFGKSFEKTLENLPASYDMRTQYAEIFGGTGHYQYSRRESIQAIRAYAQSEPLKSK